MLSGKRRSKPSNITRTFLVIDFILEFRNHIRLRLQLPVPFNVQLWECLASKMSETCMKC